MNLSNELIGYIGVLIDMEARFTGTERELLAKVNEMLGESPIADSG